MAMIVLTPRGQAASWLLSTLLPTTLLLSILPASVWVANQAWYLEHHQRIQLVVRSCHLVSAHCLPNLSDTGTILLVP